MKTKREVSPAAGRDRAWWAAERFCGDLASFVIFIVLARLLVPADYGAISLVNVLVLLGAALVTMGVGSAAARAEAAERSTAFFARLLLGLVLCAAAFFTAPLLEDVFGMAGVTELLRVLALLFPLTAVRTEQGDAALRGGRGKRACLLSLLSAAVSLALGLWLALRGYGVWALAAQLLCKTVLDAIFHLLFLGWRPGGRFSPSLLRPLLSREREERMTDFLEIFCFQLPCLLIGRRFAPEALAFYTRGQRDPEIVSKALDAAGEALPAQETELVPRLRARLLTGCCLSFPALLGLLAVASPVAAWILTERWLPFVPYLRVFCVLFLARAVLQPCVEALSEAGRGRAARLLRLLHCAVCVVLLRLAWSLQTEALWLALLPTAAALAAALAALILCARLLGYRAKDQLHDLLPTLGLSLVMAAAVFVLTTALTGAGTAPVLAAAAGIALGVVLYGGLGLLFRVPGLRCLLERVRDRLRTASPAGR